MQKRKEIEKQARLNSRSYEAMVLEALLDIRDLLVKQSKKRKVCEK